MRTSFHHQPEAQHPNFQLSTSWQADYPIFWGEADIGRSRCLLWSDANDPKRTLASSKSRSAVGSRRTPWSAILWMGLAAPKPHSERFRSDPRTCRRC